MKLTLDSHLLAHNILNENPQISLKEVWGYAFDMIRVAEENRGCGLATNQVALKIPLIICLKEKWHIFYKPKLIEVSLNESINTEGCLSLPNFSALISRPIWAKFSAIVEANGKRKIFKWCEPHSRIFLHEYEHLLGITIKEKVCAKKDMIRPTQN